MTFSLIARDDDGSFGAVIASSSPAVSARCLWLRDNVGAVATQNVTDPRLGQKGLDLLAEGSDAEAAAASLAGQANAAFRQVLIVGKEGRAAVHSGARSLGTVSSAVDGGVAAAGNLLANSHVPLAMVASFKFAKGCFEERLLIALRAGLNAGGEAGPIHSAGLAVVSGTGWRITDLRVDWNDKPVQELADILAVWLPQRDDYVTRALDPARSPGFGVAGDDRR
ncbi:MAG: fimbrial assembly protein FimA [Glaciihabitans sp.]|jgi:uncharacterized Ntn-hydrolase superfamily protein|nr:fimbrial assembly protein FimA [Glaciihabitans sp.]